jgi:hypothetical protein
MLKGLFRAKRATATSRSQEPVIGLTSSSGKRCTHGLREFATPNAYFQCDVCKDHMGVWRTMWGCRECNYDECEKCYETSKNSVRDAEKEATSKKMNFAKGTTTTESKISWACKACTYENKLGSIVCEVCNEKKEDEETPLLGNLLCSICCDATCEVAFLECGHCVTCERCANSLFALPSKQCPICRVALKSRPLRIYFA